MAIGYPIEEYHQWQEETIQELFQTQKAIGSPLAFLFWRILSLYLFRIPIDFHHFLTMIFQSHDDRKNILKEEDFKEHP